MNFLYLTVSLSTLDIPPGKKKKTSRLHNPICCSSAVTGRAYPAIGLACMVTFVKQIFVFGLSPGPVGVFSILSSTSKPSITFPKIVYFPIIVIICKVEGEGEDRNMRAR